MNARKTAAQPLHCHKVSWTYGQGTELRVVGYVPGGSVFVQSLGEDYNGVIELPAHLLASVADQLSRIAAGNAAREVMA